MQRRISGRRFPEGCEYRLIVFNRENAAMGVSPGYNPFFSSARHWNIGCCHPFPSHSTSHIEIAKSIEPNGAVEKCENGGLADASQSLDRHARVEHAGMTIRRFVIGNLK
jgi:hypothetical protein